MNDEASDFHARYARLSDNELLRLHETRHDLTRPAQEGLDQEMRMRQIEPGDVAAAQPVSGMDFGNDQISIWGYWDPISANEAVAALQKEDIDAQLVPTEVRERRDGREAAYFELVIPKSDEERAKAVLRRKQGLFPLAEDTDSRYSAPSAGDDTITVAQFDKAEDCRLAEQALTEAGIAFHATSEEWQGQTIWSVEVAVESMERAGVVIEGALPPPTEEEDATDLPVK